MGKLLTGPAACERLYLAIVGPNSSADDLARLRAAWQRNTDVWTAREKRRRDRRA